MRSIRYLNTMLTVLAVLLALHLWTAWMSAPGASSDALAQGIPDAGSQRQQMIDQLKLLNQKTDNIQGLLKSGKIRVVVTNPNEGEGDRAGR